jgi:peptidoglycan DL-endopeptidase CwlO
MVRGALTAGVVLAVVGMASTPATAEPPPANSADALEQYKQLGEQAEKVNEDLLNAQENLKTKKGELDRANADVSQAKELEQRAHAAQEEVRGRVDQLTDASFQGARFNQLAALLTSSSAQDYLERSAALGLLASQNNEAIGKLAAATAQAEEARQRAEDAQRRAQDATDAAAQLANDVAQRKKGLDSRIAELRQAMARLSNTQRASLGAPSGSCASVSLPGGAAGTAVQAALSKCGAPYVWGATGPNSFDCSGLTQWSFNKAGISLPRSAAQQYTVGSSVSQGAWQPGDLLFWGSSASSIHHVAIYVGNGQIVHASTEGVPVKITTVSGGGSDYFGAKHVTS